MLTALLVAVLGGTFIFNGVTYALWLYENRVHGAARHARSGPLLPALTGWFGEALAGLVVSLSWPFGLLERRRVTPACGRPVLLIPGWSLNRASMAVLAARLRRDGRDAYPINYSTTARDSERKGTEVAEAILDVARRSGAASVDVLAHSQGGVVVRAAARHEGVLQKLGNVVSLGSPHKGATLAATFPELGLHDLVPGSRFLERLAENDPLPTAVHFVSIYSSFDAIVFPTALSEHPGALNIRIDDVGHHGLLLSERVYRLAKENLDVDPKQR